MESKLELLINNMSFHELTVQEKGYVLEKMTEKEYTQFHDVVLNSANVFESEFHKIEPEARIKENLSNSFRAKHKEQFLDKIMVLLFPFLKSSIYKPVLTFGLIAIFFYIMIPKETKPVEVAQIKKPKVLEVKQIAIIETKDSISNIVTKNPLRRPVSNEIKATISKMSETEFLAGTMCQFKEIEQIGIDANYKIEISEDYYISIEEFISYTTILNPEIESQQLLINPEDLK